MSQTTWSVGLRIGFCLTGLGAQAALAQFGRGGPAPDIELPALRSVPAETTAAAFADPDWEVPRTSWGDPSLEGVWTTDDMRSVPLSVRGGGQGEVDVLSPLSEEEFLDRARRDEGGLERATDQETFLRNEVGLRTFGYRSLIVDPPSGQMPAMTEAGRARAGNSDRGTFGSGPFNSFDDFTLYDRCITRGVVGSTLPVIYGNGLRIAQAPGKVVISYEMIHDTRIIPLDDRPFIDEDIRQWMGNARGHWEGDTLVVETRNFTDKTSIGVNGNGTPHSGALTLTERFTRVDPEMIEYYVTVDDPVAYEAPFTIRMMITTHEGYETFEYSCHEGNGAVGHSLSGERAYEREVGEAIAAGLPVPERAGSVYGAPREGAQIFDINAGE
jgi:hypothetical protein